MQNKQCVVAADAARAQWYVVENVRRVGLGHGHRLRKVHALRRPRRRRRLASRLTQGRQGLRMAFRDGPNHNVDDRRLSWQRDRDGFFAQEVANTTREILEREGADELLIAASPQILGAIREAGEALFANGVQIKEVAKDLSTQPAGKLCNYLESRGWIDG